jgi:hypothetical protein
MATKDTLDLELDVETMQEVLSTLETMVRKIDWTLENRDPRNPENLEQRRNLIEKAARQFRAALNKRALKIAN